MFKFRYILISLILFIMLFPAGAGAATLYFEPEEGRYGPGDTFTVDLMLDVDAACINTVEAFIEYPKDVVSVLDFFTGESILSFWIERPTVDDLPEVNSEGVIHFAGGIPGGYCGKVPGDPGRSNILGRIVFAIPGMIIGDSLPEALEISIGSGSRVLMNDGAGTADELITRDAVFQMATGKTTDRAGWREQLARDNEPPNPFVVELRRDPGLFDNRYYIIFSTTDKQTGIDHYEVLETKPEHDSGRPAEPGLLVRLYDRLFSVESPPPPEWKTAETPYLLEDQALASIIRVKAVDKAGNERLVEYRPDQKDGAGATDDEPDKEKIMIMIFSAAAGVLLLLIIISIFLILKIRRRKK